MHLDRRVWVYASELGILMIHDHVDDTRMTYTDDRARDHFYLHWATEFGEPPQSRGLVEDFTGLRHHFVESGAVEIVTCSSSSSSADNLVLCLLSDKRVGQGAPERAGREGPEGGGCAV